MDSKVLTKCIVNGIIIAELIMAVAVAIGYFIVTHVEIDKGAFVGVVLIGLIVAATMWINSSGKKRE